MRSPPHCASPGPAETRTIIFSRLCSRPHRQPEKLTQCGRSGRSSSGSGRATVVLPPYEKISLIASLLGRAAKLVAISTVSPKLPKEMDLPVERRVALLRSLYGWTQEELAEAARVSRADVRCVESGSSTLSPLAIDRICKVLNIASH